MLIRLISWNVARRHKPWDELDELGSDVALLQEASRPPVPRLGVIPEPGSGWATTLRGGAPAWRTAIVQLTDKVELVERPTFSLDSATRAEDWVVSRQGSATAADVSIGDRRLFTAVSVYAAWEMAGSRGFADGSAHRLLSDLSALLDRRDHRLIVAGDWNLLYGYGEYADPYWKARYDTVFERAEAMGLRFAGPWAPNGRQADPWPNELPPDSRCVPTFHHSGQTPLTATRQLDFVFVSKTLVDSVSVDAVNDTDRWGSSDHCRILIDIDA